MKTDVKRHPDATVEIAVVLEDSEMRPYVERAALKFSQEKTIEGFRPGKAPFAIVKNAVGEMRIYERAIAFAIDGTLPNIIREEKLRVVGRPEIAVTKVAPGNPLEFTLKTAIVPDFTLPDIHSIAKKILAGKIAPAVEEKELDDALHWLRKSRATKKSALRPAAKGDHVEIDFKAKTNGTTLEKGSSENHPLILGEGKFVPGFEDRLMGMSQGEEASFSVAMPADYHEKNLAGKTVDFDVTIKKVEEEELPELNDEFAKTLGKFSTVAELKENIEGGLRQEKETKECERIRIAIADAIAGSTDITVANILIQSELDKMIEELRQNIDGMGLKFDDYLAHLKKTEVDLRKDWLTDAKRRVKIALILGAIAEERKIEPTLEEIESELGRILQKYGTPEEAARDIDPDAARDYARSIARNEKIFRYLEMLAV